MKQSFLCWLARWAISLAWVFTVYEDGSTKYFLHNMCSGIRLPDMLPAASCWQPHSSVYFEWYRTAQGLRPLRILWEGPPGKQQLHRPRAFSGLKKKYMHTERVFTCWLSRAGAWKVHSPLKGPKHRWPLWGARSWKQPSLRNTSGMLSVCGCISWTRPDITKWEQITKTRPGILCGPWSSSLRHKTRPDIQE